MSTAAALASTEIEPTPTALSKLSNNTSSDVTSDQRVLETSIQAVIACNSISVAACLLVIVIYALLHRKYTRVMQRTSLVLSCAMATADLLLHTTNLVGYLYLPPGFACDFIGGWLYAFPSLLSVFYSCCIALNSQLYFVFRREPKDTDRGIGTLLQWYIITPIVVSGIICFTALGAGLYGYDSIFGYCWFASPPKDPDHPHQLQLRPFIGMMTTFGGWCLLALCYLLIASSTVTWVVYWKSLDVEFGGHIGLRRSQRKFSGQSSIPISSAYHRQWVGQAPSSTDIEMQKQYRLHSEEFESREKASLSVADDVNFFGKKSSSDIHDENDTELQGSDREQAGERDWNIRGFSQKRRYSFGAAHPRRTDTAVIVQEEQLTISRRTLALRAMTLRLIGYILIPVICILPSVIMDVIVKAHPVGDVEIPDAVTGFFDGINGLVGLFNAILFLLDPVLLIIWAELRANRHWGLWQKERTESQYAGPENVTKTNAVDVPRPLQDTNPPGSNGGNEQVGGIHTTRFGKADSQPMATRAFEDSLIASVPLPRLDVERRSLRPTRAGPKLLHIKGVGHRKRHESRRNGGNGLTVHVQVEIAKYSDLERVDDYLHGL